MTGETPIGHFDVDSKEQLPSPAAGYRYLDFLGGTRHLRCFLVPEDMPRNAFMETFAALDECHLPVYKHRGVTVRQDSSYALPGFYIVSFDRPYASLDAIDQVGSVVAAVVTRDLRLGMRHELGIDHVHLHYEEKAEASCNVHYWIMPVSSRPHDKSTLITRLDIKQYLGQFRFQDQRALILEYNTRMRQYLVTAGTASRVDAIAAAMQHIESLAENR